MTSEQGSNQPKLNQYSRFLTPFSHLVLIENEINETKRRINNPNWKKGHTEGLNFVSLGQIDGAQLTPEWFRSFLGKNEDVPLYRVVVNSIHFSKDKPRTLKAGQEIEQEGINTEGKVVIGGESWLIIARQSGQSPIQLFAKALLGKAKSD